MKFCKIQKFRTEKIFVEYCELSLKFWMMFAHFIAIFHGMNQS
jgi:hypothetical protein